MTAYIITGLVSFIIGAGGVAIIDRTSNKSEPVVIAPQATEEALTKPDALVDVCSGGFIEEHGVLTCTLRTCLVAGSGPGTTISPSCDSLLNIIGSTEAWDRCEESALYDGVVDPDKSEECRRFIKERK